MTEPVDRFILRKLNPEQKLRFDRLSNGINEVVNFGTHLLDWGLQKKGTYEDLPALLFLRNFLENLDAISILVQNSVIHPCNGLLRTALENFFSIEYILLDESKNQKRARSFIFCNYKTNQKWLKKGVPGTQEAKELKTKIKNDRYLKDFSPTLNGAESMLPAVEALINDQEYRDIRSEYEEKRKLIGNPMWYSLFDGPRSIERLAVVLGYPTFYEYVYRGWSETTHGVDIVQQRIHESPEGLFQLVALRNKTDTAESVAQYCMNFSMLTFNVFIEKVAPERKAEFKEWLEEAMLFNASLNPLEQK